MSDALAVSHVEQQVATDARWPVFLAAEWRDLVMLNYEIDPDHLLPLLPRETELDLFQGRALISVVGFRFLNTRVLGVPVPFHRNFPEVNLRFYVRRHAQGELRRGVAFVKEIVSKRAVAAVARWVFHENYVRLPMREQIDNVAGHWQAEFGWRRAGSWETVAAETTATLAAPPKGSETQFITEHYWGYSRQPDGGCVEYRVEHPSWQVATAETARLDCDPARLYGEPFADALAAEPCSAFLVDGSAVTVSRGRRLA